MKFKILNNLALIIDNIVPEKYLSKLQEFLLSGAIFTDASKVLAILIIIILICDFALILTITIFNLPISVLIFPLFVIPGLFTYVVYQQEKRAQEIEKTAPDFLSPWPSSGRFHRHNSARRSCCCPGRRRCGALSPYTPPWCRGGSNDPPSRSARRPTGDGRFR